jgi:hypothetical protein
MLRRRIRSALFIDYENLPLPPGSIANWLAWLEDGAFDDDKPRRFLVKKVFWNPAAIKHSATFEEAGFDVVLCERFAELGNSLDIRMAIDIVETCRKNSRINEFILATTDSDFIPVLQKLNELGKRSAVVVDPTKMNVYTTYRQHADTLILRGDLIGARTYKRPEPGFFARLTKGPRRKVAAVNGPNGAAATKPRTETSGANAGGDRIDLAVDKVIKIASTQPNRETAQRKVLAELRGIEGFATSGREQYLGTGSYKALMTEVAKRDERIRILKKNRGGTAIMYVPKE